MTGAAEPLLALQGVTGGYGETVVVEGIDLALAPGESLAVLGRNGTGKTSLLRLVMGLADLHRGGISFAGDDISRRPVHARNRAGLGFVPQEREIFASLTVQENLAVAGRVGSGGDWSADRVYAMFPRLAERRANRGNQLSGGEQQMLAIGRALMGDPRLLLLDEPSEGLAPVIVEELERAIGALRDEGGLAVILVEQHTRFALDFAPRAIVLDRGRIVFDGESGALRDPEVLQRHMGLAQ
ncbi:ABC transporter ATP-binding protein [Marinibaculum pumilum]|uniref:ABC transporter ATP-binding protein n=1 Tax=Marinibaculum pumilum TaxID=1766165 RepID=A0ABV7L1G9_9PROT